MPKKSRMTEQKNAILTYLKRTKSHPTAEKVFNALRHRLKQLSLATVYRNLEFLKNQGSAIEITDEHGKAHFDGYMTPHDHFYCKNCQKVYDINEKSVLGKNSRKNLAKKMRGFKIYSYQLIFSGNCCNCQKNNN